MNSSAMTKPPALPSPISARSLAAYVVALVLDHDRWSQPALHEALQRCRLDDRDKALCTELVYGTLRHAPALEKSLLRGADKPTKGLDSRLRPHLLVAAYQLHHLAARIPAHAAVDEAVRAVGAERPGLRGFANALLRRLGSPLADSLPATASMQQLAEAHSVPLWVAHDVVAGLPARERGDALAAMSARPHTYATGPRTPTDAVMHPFVPGVWQLAGGRVIEVDGFAEGDFWVQDPGSALCALLVGAQPGEVILDLCAAPGGKTLWLAQAVGSTGKVIAVEQDARRAQSIIDNAKRLQMADRIEVVVADATDANAVQQALRGARPHAVLLDAPCSGLGTTRRKPEIKLRRKEADIVQSSALQRTLLKVAAGLVPAGGRLVYSVCSPMYLEGAGHMAALPSLGMQATPADLPWLPSSCRQHGGVALRPHRDDADAFFMFRAQRP
jgi:16S rRNA (cytosine967-C5)-methyltransferase